MHQRILVYLMSVLIPMNLFGQELHWNDTVADANQILRCTIFFQYNSDEILPESLQVLDSLRNFLKLNSSWVFEVGVHSDTRGSENYSTKLTAKRAEGLRMALIEKGTEEYRLKSKAYEGTAPIISKENIAGMKSSDQENAHAKNRRIELKAVGKFLNPDWEKYTIPPDFNLRNGLPVIGEIWRLGVGYDIKGMIEPEDPVLKFLTALLIENPGAQIELTCHTDQRGDFRYNEELSFHRASSLSIFLESKGVKTSQYTCTGYGESRSIIPEQDILLMCPPDQEKAYEINRRIELKFLKI